jgi:thioredoxin reductase (NADPH)
MKNITLYGADWCHDCVRAKAYLNDNNIDFTFVDVDQNKAAANKVEQINNGKRIIPTILIDDIAYTNPNNAELSEALNSDGTAGKIIVDEKRAVGAACEIDHPENCKV